MKTTILFRAFLALLPAFVSAHPFKLWGFRTYVPPPSGPRPFLLIAAHKGDERFDLQTINASDGLFWIGRPTSTFCPSFPGIRCPPGNETVVTATPRAESFVSTSHLAPLEQMLYVRNSTQPMPGALSFIPISTNLPLDYFQHKFTIPRYELTYAGSNWWACPAMGAFYVQAAVNSPGESCVDIEIHTLPYWGESPAAWEYV